MALLVLGSRAELCVRLSIVKGLGVNVWKGALLMLMPMFPCSVMIFGNSCYLFQRDEVHSRLLREKSAVNVFLGRN